MLKLCDLKGFVRQPFYWFIPCLCKITEISGDFAWVLICFVTGCTTVLFLKFSWTYFQLVSPNGKALLQTRFIINITVTSKNCMFILEFSLLLTEVHLSFTLSTQAAIFKSLLSFSYLNYFFCCNLLSCSATLV